MSMTDTQMLDFMIDRGLRVYKSSQVISGSVQYRVMHPNGLVVEGTWSCSSPREAIEVAFEKLGWYSTAMRNKHKEQS